jgi:pilus assembly protein CpaC
MHRKNCVPRFMCWTVLLGVLVGGAVGAGSVAAQDSPPPSLLVPINGTKKLQMSGKQLIKTVQNQDPNVARVSPIPDEPTAVLVTGMMAGSTRVTLTDKDNRSESFDVIVQLDVAFLRKVLQDTVPSANIIPVPVGTGSIILSGTVAKPEDIPIVLDVARSILGGIQLTNALRVGGVQQVELCVTVALVSRTTMRQMSFEFLRTGPNNGISSTLGGVPTFTSTLGPINATALNSVISTAAPGNLFYGILTPQHGFFGWLEALRTESVTKILAEPKVTTISGRPASFLSGGEQAIPVPAGLGQVGVQFEEFGTRLNVLPIVLGNGKIHLEVEPEESDLSAGFGTSIAGTTVPGRTVQRVHTTVELETGQTFAIGGLVQHKINGSATKIPIIGDLPFIGAAFRGVNYTDEEDELLILVTPHLVDPLACNQLPKYFPGQETRSPDDFELFLEGILEAPRGVRETFPNGCYQAAWKSGPTADAFPCGNRGFGTHGNCDCTDGVCGSGSSCHGCGGPCGTCGAGGCGVSGGAGLPAVTAPGMQTPVTAPAVLPTAPAPLPAGARSAAQPDVGTTAALGSVPPAGAAAGARPDGVMTLPAATGEVNGNANPGTAVNGDQR